MFEFNKPHYIVANFSKQNMFNSVHQARQINQFQNRQVQFSTSSPDSHNISSGKQDRLIEKIPRAVQFGSSTRPSPSNPDTPGISSSKQDKLIKKIFRAVPNLNLAPALTVSTLDNPSYKNPDSPSINSPDSTSKQDHHSPAFAQQTRTIAQQDRFFAVCSKQEDHSKTKRSPSRRTLKFFDSR